MQLRSLLPAALALAASAGAFLVPANTDGDAIDAFNSHPVDSGKAAGIRIPCPGCYVTEDAFKDTDLLLEFSQKDNKIYLGQTPVYPLNPAAASAMGKQVKTEDSDFEMADTDVHLSTRMEVVNTVPLNDKGLTVSEFRLEVLGIDDRVVHVGTVSFAVFDHHDDKTVAMSEPKLIPTVTTLADASCTTVLCRVKAQIAAKVAALKAAAGKFKSGCMRMMGMHPHGPHRHHHGHHGHPEEKPEDVSADRTEQVPPSKPMDRLKGGPEKIKGMMGGKKPCAGRHGAIRKLIHGVAVFAKHVLMPVLVGVAAGMAVSAFGMVIGQLIFMIVMRIRARRNGGYVAVYQVVSEDDIDDLEARLEKNAEDEIDPLPRYEAGEHVLPPAYDEKRDGEQH